MTTGSLVAIVSDALRAEIDPFGAQLFSLRDLGAGDGIGGDLLWNGDPAVWASRAPILFPIVGALREGRYRIGDRQFALPRHGFARHRPFALLESTASSATFGLRADDTTLAVYPFRFELDICFALAGATLAVTASIRNPGAEPMPASFGFHPAFHWPLPYGAPRAAHGIRFAQDEPARIRKLDADGLILPAEFASPIEGRDLLLHDDLFAEDALIFDRISSRSLRYGAAEGPGLEIDYAGMPMLGIWSKPGAGFVAIEPWHGIADPEGFDGDLHAKPGIFLVPPGGTQSCRMAITLRR